MFRCCCVSGSFDVYLVCQLDVVYHLSLGDDTQLHTRPLGVRPLTYPGGTDGCHELREDFIFTVGTHHTRLPL